MIFQLKMFGNAEPKAPDNFIAIDKWSGRSMTRLCIIYEKRPKICRDFEIGEYENVACPYSLLPDCVPLHPGYGTDPGYSTNSSIFSER